MSFETKHTCGIAVRSALILEVMTKENISYKELVEWLKKNNK